jgi:hypothetical protein
MLYTTWAIWQWNWNASDRKKFVLTEQSSPLLYFYFKAIFRYKTCIHHSRPSFRLLANYRNILRFKLLLNIDCQCVRVTCGSSEARLCAKRTQSDFNANSLDWLFGAFELLKSNFRSRSDPAVKKLIEVDNMNFREFRVNLRRSCMFMTMKTISITITMKQTYRERSQFLLPYCS